MPIHQASASSYYNRLNAEMPEKQGFQRQTYTWLAQQPADAIIPNPNDVVIIESQITPTDETPTEANGNRWVNPNIPAICPLKESSTASWWTMVKTNPLWQHAKQWGLYSAGVGLGTVVMGTVLGGGQQQWKAADENATIQELRIKTSAWWQQKSSANSGAYQASVQMPNNPWGDTALLNLEMLNENQATLHANGKPALKLEKLYKGDDKTPYFEVKFLDAAAIDEHSEPKKEWQVLWDATAKKFELLGKDAKPLVDKLEDPLTHCLTWLDEPETLKKGLKQDALFPYKQGLNGAVGLAAFLTAGTALLGAGIWQFHKRPKPVNAVETNINSLPSV